MNIKDVIAKQMGKGMPMKKPGSKQVPAKQVPAKKPIPGKFGRM